MKEILISLPFQSKEEFEEIQKSLIMEVLLEVLNSNPPPSITENSYFTRQEVASLLKISLPTLNKRTKDGNLVAYKLGNRVLYKWSEIIASLDKVEPLKYRRAQ